MAEEVSVTLPHGARDAFHAGLVITELNEGVLSFVCRRVPDTGAGSF